MKEQFSKCRVCGSTGEINEFGFCRKCVQERARRLIDAHGTGPAKILPSSSPIEVPRIKETPQETMKTIPKTSSAAPFQSRVSSSVADDSQIVADHDIVTDWERERKQRKVECDRLETQRIEDAREREIAAFKSNIAELKVLRDIGNSLELEIKYRRPIRNKSDIPRELERFGDLFGGIFESLQVKINETVRPSDEEKLLSDNRFTIKITLKPGDTFVRIISGGNYDFMDGTARGYWLDIILAQIDDLLLRILIKTCKRVNDFKFLQSAKSATGLLVRSNISYEEAGTLLDKIKDQVVKELTSIHSEYKAFEGDLKSSEFHSSELPQDVPRKVVDSILSDLADIKTKEVYTMIQNGYAYNDRQAAEKISYDNYVAELAKSYDLPTDTIKQIISYWETIQRR